MPTIVLCCSGCQQTAIPTLPKKNVSITETKNFYDIHLLQRIKTSGLSTGANMRLKFLGVSKMPHSI